MSDHLIFTWLVKTKKPPRNSSEKGEELTLVSVHPDLRRLKDCCSVSEVNAFFEKSLSFTGAKVTLSCSLVKMICSFKQEKQEAGSKDLKIKVSNGCIWCILGVDSTVPFLTAFR